MTNSLFQDTIKVLKSQEISIAVTDIDGVNIAYLKIVKPNLPNLSKLAKHMSKWRNRNSNRYATQFKATPENALNYLTNIANSDVQAMFFIEDISGAILGHFGFKLSQHGDVELDNLARSEVASHSQLVYYVELTLLFIIFCVCNIETSSVMVLKSNRAPQALHKMCGFKKEKEQTIPVKKEIIDGITKLIPCDPGEDIEDYFLYFKLQKESFLRRNISWIFARI